MRIGEADKKAFWGYYEFGAMTVEQVAIITGWHINHARRRVRQWRKERLVVPIEVDPDFENGHLNQPKTDGLGNLGAREIGIGVDELTGRMKKIGFSHNAKRRTSDQTLQHDIKAAALALKAKECIEAHPTLTYIPSPERISRVNYVFEVKVNFEDKRDTVRLKPDFHVIFDNGKQERFHPVEFAHRKGTFNAMSLKPSSRMRKAIGYDAAITKKLFKDELGYKSATPLFVEMERDWVDKTRNVFALQELDNDQRFYATDYESYMTHGATAHIWCPADRNVCLRLEDL